MGLGLEFAGGEGWDDDGGGGAGGGEVGTLGATQSKHTATLKTIQYTASLHFRVLVHMPMCCCLVNGFRRLLESPKGTSPLVWRTRTTVIS